MTPAVIEARCERLDRLQRVRRAPTAAKLQAIGERCAAELPRPPKQPADLLYDDHGLLK